MDVRRHFPRFVRGGLGLGLALALVCLAACADPDPGHAPRPPVDLEASVERFALDNGLQVLVHTNRTVSLVTALVVVRAGAFYEDEDTDGYAHLFEHMIFKGSADVPDDVEFRQRLEATGAAYNAATQVDWVRYYVSASKEQVDDALELMAGALREPLLDPDELDKEIQVVIDEFDVQSASYDWQQQRVMRRQLWGDGFRRLDALGSKQAVRKATVAAMRRAHKARYRPDNAALILTGDIDRAEATRLARAHFGDWKAAKAPVADASELQLPPLDRGVGRVVELPVTQSTLVLGFRLPGFDQDAEVAAYAQLLEWVTLQTDHPFRGLVGPGKAFGAGLSHQVYREAGYLYATVRMPFGLERRLLTELRDQMDALAEPDNTTRWQFEQAQRMVWRDGFESRTDPFDAAVSLASAWIRDDVEGFEDLTSDVYSTSVGRMREMAARFIAGQPAVAVLLTSADNARRNFLDGDTLEGLL